MLSHYLTAELIARTRWRGVFLVVLLISANILTARAQSQAGVLYVTANLQEQTISLFGLPAIAPKPRFPITRLFGGNTRVRGDRFSDGFFAATVGYHLNDRLRADVSLVSYTGLDEQNGTYRLGQGATYHTQHSVRAIDVPLRAYYNLRCHPRRHRWVWYTIGTISYTDLRRHRDFEVIGGDNPRRIQAEENFDNLFVGSGIRLRFKMTQALELYQHIDLAFGTLRGAFRGNVMLGIKINLNLNNRYVLPSMEPSDSESSTNS